MTNKIKTVLKAITDRIAGTLPSDMVKNPKLEGITTANAVIDCRMTKIAVREGITMSVFDLKGVDLGAQSPYYARRDFLDCHFPGEWEISRDVELNPFKDTLVFRRMDKPPKNRDGAWHAKIRLIDPDGEEFTKTLQSIPTTGKLSERENMAPLPPREQRHLFHRYQGLEYSDPDIVDFNERLERIHDRGTHRCSGQHPLIGGLDILEVATRGGKTWPLSQVDNLSEFRDSLALGTLKPAIQEGDAGGIG
ncbi:hypothetical protein Tco_0325065 [Tanacetum coccineum]